MVTKNQRGVAATVILIAFIWVLIAAGAAVLVYRHSANHNKPYATPADASKLPKRP